MISFSLNPRWILRNAVTPTSHASGRFISTGSEPHCHTTKFSPPSELASATCWVVKRGERPCAIRVDISGPIQKNGGDFASHRNSSVTKTLMLVPSKRTLSASVASNAIGNENHSLASNRLQKEQSSGIESPNLGPRIGCEATASAHVEISRDCIGRQLIKGKNHQPG